MSIKVREAHSIFLVPYAAEEPSRENPYTTEMEEATILLFSEAKRRKAGILIGGSEKVTCIAKIYYLFWAVPWEDNCIIIDGLGLDSSNVVYRKIPNILKFVEDLNRCSSSFSSFLEALRRHSHTFQGFRSLKVVSLRGVVGEQSILEALGKALRESSKISGKDMLEQSFVPLALSRRKAEAKAQRMVNQWNILNDDVDALLYAIDVLDSERNHHKEKIILEMKEIKEDYDSRISKTKKMVDRKVRSLVKEKEKAKGKIEKTAKQRLGKIIKEEDRLKERIERLNLLLREALDARKRQKKRYPKRSTTRIDNKIAKCKSNIKILKDRLSELKRRAAEIRKEMLKKINEAEREYRLLIEEELNKIDALEEAKESEISKRSELISRIDTLSSTIESQIRTLIEKKTKDIRKIEEKTVPFKIEETSLIAVPFYIAIFESSSKVRAEVFPPAVAKSYTSTLQRIKRMLFSFSLEARMRLLLGQRFPSLSEKVSEKLERKIESDAPFRKALFKVGMTNNLLGSPKFMSNVKEGIERLLEEGWINKDEAERTLKEYSKM